MPNEATTASPILTLREHATALEAAIMLVLADPRPKPVHRLRTSTRRIEAQLALLELLPGLPDHAKPAGKVVKALRKLRRAAGKVRDLDVQGDLLEAARPERGRKTGAKAPSKAAGKDRGKRATRSPADSGETKGLHKDARTLAKVLAEERKEQTDALAHVLQKQQAKVSLALEALLEALEPAGELELAPSRVLALAEEWYLHNTPAEALESADSDRLHSVRKAAKLARYAWQRTHLAQKGRRGEGLGRPPTLSRFRQAAAPGMTCSRCESGRANTWASTRL